MGGGDYASAGQLVEYSQPVLYSHFAGKDAIVRAVAIEGFADLAVRLRQARAAFDEPGRTLRAVCGAYLSFAAERPALYQPCSCCRPT